MPPFLIINYREGQAKCTPRFPEQAVICPEKEGWMGVLIWWKRNRLIFLSGKAPWVLFAAYMLRSGLYMRSGGGYVAKNHKYRNGLQSLTW